MTAVGKRPEAGAGDEEAWRARDYAELDEAQRGRVDYPEGLRRTGIRSGTRLLDVGCGPGAFCHLAARAGAEITGFDASPGMLQIARERVPSGHFDVGDMRQLPYGDASFDVVTLFNSLQFCGDPAAALREVRRVTRPGGSVFIAIFGRPEHIEVAAKWRALAALLPPTRPPAPGPLALSGDGVLDALVAGSGLTVAENGYLEGYFDIVMRRQCFARSVQPCKRSWPSAPLVQRP